MPNITTLVIATYNKGKIAEITALLKNFPVRIKSLESFGPLPPLQEDGTTFEENSYQKASFASRILGLPALADDSGLSVEALGGAPGVFSARFAGEHATDDQRCDRILSEMHGKTNRKAAFDCVISIAVPTGRALTYEARVEGLIAEAPAGSNGFGYDPIFFYPSIGKTFAQMSREEKNRISHRGKALKELQDEFEKVLLWIDQQMPVFEKIVHDEE
jgi:XTP/dITP diphosphohydrolase